MLLTSIGLHAYSKLWEMTALDKPAQKSLDDLLRISRSQYSVQSAQYDQSEERTQVEKVGMTDNYNRARPVLQESHDQTEAQQAPSKKEQQALEYDDVINDMEGT